MTVNDIETHPWPPFILEGAGVLFLGTVPPQPKRWAMNFYYPNRTNDFWKIMGIIMENNPEAFYDKANKSYHPEKIKEMLVKRRIALADTGIKVRRLRDNASDKFLEIVETLDLPALLETMPQCRAIGAAGEKAASVVASIAGIPIPPIGIPSQWTLPSGRIIGIWRLPSTSRAYPLAPEKKAEAFRKFLKEEGIIG